jgi:hypothetical protein
MFIFSKSSLWPSGPWDQAIKDEMTWVYSPKLFHKSLKTVVLDDAKLSVTLYVFVNLSCHSGMT